MNIVVYLMKDNIILIILFISSLLILTEEISLYNITNFEKISINNSLSACIYIKKSDEIEKDKNFFIIISSNEPNASINETLSYNYIDSCPSSLCSDFEFKNQAECKLSWDKDGFTYYYYFPKEGDKYMMVRYYQFTGKILYVEYSKSDRINEFVAVYHSVDSSKDILMKEKMNNIKRKKRMIILCKKNTWISDFIHFI